MKTKELLEEIENKDLMQFLPEVNMTDRDKEIVAIYVQEKPTLTALAERYDISRERVRQIMWKFCRKAHAKYKKIR